MSYKNVLVKATKVSVAITCILLFASACSNDDKEDTIFYGEEVVLENFFETKDGETLTPSVSVDSKTVGQYEVKAMFEDGDTNTREETKVLTVVDEEPAQINLVQTTDKVYEIPYNTEFNPIGNIDSITDSIDGEYTTIRLVTKETLDSEESIVKEALESTRERLFITDDEVNTYKEERPQHSYTLVQSDINIEEAGMYSIYITSVDASYNLTKIDYKVKVLEEGEEVQTDLLAAGAEGSTMGNALNYEIIDEVNVEEEVETSENETDEVLPQAKSQQNFDSNIQSSGSISAQGSPVLQAALNYVGSHMMCDELATMALVDAGHLTGTPQSIFKSGNLYNIGVYQMPAIGTYITEAQAVPGDLILYDNGGYGSAHVAVYAGNAKAVHGGYNGANVVISTVHLGSGPRYFRVPPMTWKDISKKVFNQDIDDNGNVIFPEWESPTPDTPPVIPNNPTPENPPVDNPNPPTPDDTPDWADSPNTVHTYTFNGISIKLTAPNGVDENFVWDQLSKVDAGEITKDQLYANLRAKGYTIVE